MKGIKMRKEEMQELFVKSDNNPILTSADWPYRVDHVFNPAATMYDGQTVLLVRAEDRRGFSHLSMAKSKDGVTNWKVDQQPTLEADPTNNEYKKGLEDPRIIWLEEIKEYIIACVSFRAEKINTPCGISLIGTKDFHKFRRISKPLDPENKNASLFPRKIKGLFALLHRPVIDGRSYIAVSFSEDLVYWKEEVMLFSTRRWYWDSDKIGLACPPIETKKGWLIIYHGSCGKANRLIYRVGLALLDLETLKLIRRSPEWVLRPEKDYEGHEDGIVFPCGYILDEKTKELRVYYGTNDSKVGLAISNLDEVISFIMKCPEE